MFPPLRSSRLVFPGIAVLAMLLGLAGCSLVQPKEQVRGNLVDADRLKELTPGTTTRADVTALLGSPTMRATFEDNTWIYVGMITRPRIGGTQAIEEQKVVVLSFDDRGVLTNVGTRSDADALPVSVVERTTPTPGSEASFLQQLFGNIGRFNTAGATGGLGGGSGPSGGAPKPY